MPTPVFETDLPADPAYASFVDGEKCLSPVAALGDVAAYASFWMSRRLYLPPGKYAVKLISDDAVTLRIGSSFASSRVVASSVFGDGAVNIEFFVLAGETRIDLLLHNLSSAPQPCFAVFSLFREGKIIYISAAADWLFDTVPIPDASLLGDTAVEMPVFTLLPNWRDGINERLSWLTDIINSQTGDEQRRSVRVFPRRSFEAGFMRTREQRGRLDAFITGIGRRPFYMPLWHEQYRVPVAFGLSTVGVSLPAATAINREFRAGTLVFVNNGDPGDYEVAEIETLDVVSGAITWTAALTKPWPAGTRIMPLRRARFTEDSQMTRPSDSVGEARLRFDLVDPDDQFVDPLDDPATTALSAPSWNHCAPLFQFSPNFATALTFTFNRDDFMLDNQSGVVEFTDPSEQARITQRLTLLLRGREAVFNYRRFIAKARGRAVRFYMPTFTHDVVPTGDIAGDYLDCKPAGFAELIQIDQEARTMLGIVFKDGSPTIYRTVTSVLAVNDGLVDTSERFYLDAALPAISLSAVKRIEWIVTSRFDQDTFELQHHVDDSAAVTAAVVTRSVNGDDMANINC